MTAQASSPEPDGPRFTRRYASKATASIVRETDQMRTGIPAVLRDISNDGLSLIVETELDVGEQIKVQLKNEIQRFEKLVRGVIRHVEPTEDGKIVCGVELYTRLTPLEVSLARSAIVPGAGAEGDGPIWI